MVCLSVPREAQARWGRGSAVALWLILSLCLCLPSLTPSRDSSLANSLTEHTRQRGEEEEAEGRGGRMWRYRTLYAISTHHLYDVALYCCLEGRRASSVFSSSSSASAVCPTAYHGGWFGRAQMTAEDRHDSAVYG